MATAYGVQPSGFVAKPLSTVADEIDSGLQGILGQSAGTESDGTIPVGTYAGQLKALLVDGFAAHWDLQQANYSSRDPNQATDASQDAVCALTGTVRDAAQFSTVTVTCTGDPGTILLANRVLSVAVTGSLFQNLADSAAFPAAAAWAQPVLYTVGTRRTNAGNVYECITQGTSAGSGPTTTAADITDGTAHWKFLGSGTSVLDVAFTAVVAGAIGANAGTLSTIVTPVNGWRGAVNESDALVGRAIETNTALRARRDAELATTGNTTADAIRADILNVNAGSTDPNHQPPTDCKVFHNDTDFVNADGLPAHSVEVLVKDGTDADIVQAIWKSVGAGTATVGNTTSTTTDSQGNTQTVNWSRPVSVPVYMSATIYYDASKWPVGTPTSTIVQYALSALLTFTSEGGVGLGQSVRTSPLNAAILRGRAEVDSSNTAVFPAAVDASSIPGIIEVTSLLVDIVPVPVTTLVSITARQIATFDSGRCTLVATAETP